MEEPTGNLNLMCVALYDFNAFEVKELSFLRGDLLSLEIQDKSGWARGNLNGRSGWFPLHYVSELEPSEFQSIHTPEGEIDNQKREQLIEEKLLEAERDICIEEINEDLGHLNELRRKISIRRAELLEELDKLTKGDEQIIEMLEEKAERLNLLLSRDPHVMKELVPGDEPHPPSPSPQIARLSRELIDPKPSAPLSPNTARKMRLTTSSGSDGEGKSPSKDKFWKKMKDKTKNGGGGKWNPLTKWGKKDSAPSSPSCSISMTYDVIPENIAKTLLARLPMRRVIPIKEGQILGKFTGPTKEEAAQKIRAEPEMGGASGKFSEKGEIAAGKSVSTYPWTPNKKARDGDPICDRFGVQIHPNRILVTLADGCNWGKRPEDAADKAASCFLFSVDEKQSSIRSISDAGELILASIEAAHRNIFLGKDEWEVGTTTLIGGILLETLENSEWMFVCGSIGDCKAFHWSKSKRKFTDITAGNRSAITDARDPGGRLGPAQSDNLPDLRNLGLYFQECVVGDLIIVVSDGVHDNLDPQMLGKSPKDVGIPTDDWEKAEKLSPEAADLAKTQSRLNVLASIFEKLPNANEPCPSDVVDALVKYAVDLTQPTRAFMEAHSDQKQPADYVQFPGKLDHTTCICIRVGEASKISNNNNQ
eukprot:TRINITY_DN10280_c0_g1_i1.p1 TRINITY_DN10280_c0_g1~~TRINITY_DN10280_c0_g1_i1.p1  ORF type:complete len:649 (+),score=163.72 TRINITY_DN10280_c0_g1_i1:75-2021(+)